MTTECKKVLLNSTEDKMIYFNIYVPVKRRRDN